MSGDGSANVVVKPKEKNILYDDFIASLADIPKHHNYSFEEPTSIETEMIPTLGGQADQADPVIVETIEEEESGDEDVYNERDVEGSADASNRHSIIDRHNPCRAAFRILAPHMSSDIETFPRNGVNFRMAEIGELVFEAFAKIVTLEPELQTKLAWQRERIVALKRKEAKVVARLKERDVELAELHANMEQVNKKCDEWKRLAGESNAKVEELLGKVTGGEAQLVAERQRFAEERTELETEAKFKSDVLLEYATTSLVRINKEAHAYHALGRAGIAFTPPYPNYMSDTSRPTPTHSAASGSSIPTSLPGDQARG